MEGTKLGIIGRGIPIGALGVNIMSGMGGACMGGAYICGTCICGACMWGTGIWGTGICGTCIGGAIIGIVYIGYGIYSRFYSPAAGGMTFAPCAFYFLNYTEAGCSFFGFFYWVCLFLGAVLYGVTFFFSVFCPAILQSSSLSSSFSFSSFSSFFLMLSWSHKFDSSSFDTTYSFSGTFSVPSSGRYRSWARSFTFTVTISVSTALN